MKNCFLECIALQRAKKIAGNFNMTAMLVTVKVPIEILPGKRHITWVLAVLLFTEEFQMEPLASNVICYTSQENVLNQIG